MAVVEVRPAVCSVDQFMPQRKFLATVIPALFASNSLQLSKIAEACGPCERAVPQTREYDTREHYLSRNVGNRDST